MINFKLKKNENLFKLEFMTDVNNSNSQSHKVSFMDRIVLFILSLYTIIGLIKEIIRLINDF